LLPSSFPFFSSYAKVYFVNSSGNLYQENEQGRVKITKEYSGQKAPGYDGGHNRYRNTLAKMGSMNPI
jgi:hypothetical protein